MPKLQHERCNTCWTCPDCGARWCYDFCEDYAHACYNDDLDELDQELPEAESEGLFGEPN